MTHFYVVGRSIDGTVYAAHGGWSSSRRDMRLFPTHEEAERVVLARRLRNQTAEPDHAIGQLLIKEHTK